MNSILPLEIRQLSYRVNGRLLLDNISLTLTDRHLTVILGANGAGKTLLMKACTGLIQPTRGEVHWQPEEHTGREGSGFTLVLQKPVLLRRTALANIVYALHALPKDQRSMRAREALQWAGCETLATQAAQTLSSGQQQLVALARAWAIRPQVLFLDEPCANLDPEVSLRLEQLILALHLQGVKVVMSTHNLAQAQRLAGEIVFVDKGRIAEHSPAADFFNAPQCEGAKRYLALESPLDWSSASENSPAVSKLGLQAAPSTGISN